MNTKGFMMICSLTFEKKSSKKPKSQKKGPKNLGVFFLYPEYEPNVSQNTITFSFGLAVTT